MMQVEDAGFTTELQLALQIIVALEIKHRVVMDWVNGAYVAKIEVADACMKSGWMEIQGLRSALKWLGPKVQ